ncbi:MAG: hypothetical protein GEV03_16280 [Streptosporangiales bacterium]|nr:hypothetical protein [Streptosporangiales bacterium]
MAELTSPVEEVEDFWAWDELARRNNWTDGLPVAPPTEERVTEILDYLGRDPREVIGTIMPGGGIATVEQIVIQCVMAGCEPEHVPVVMAAVEAMLAPEFNLYGVQCTTNAAAPLTIVSGPAVERLGFNCKEGAFGGGSHANAAVGRAVRLVLWNIGGGHPGQTDMSTLGQPAKYLFCVAENHEDSPWAPIHADHGLDPGQSAVTVFACQSPDPLFVPGTAERILNVIAASLPTAGVNMFHAAGQFLLTIGVRPAQELARGGYDKEDVRQWIFKHARFNLGRLRKSGVLVEDEGHQYYWGHGEEDVPDLPSLPDDTMLPLVRTPSDIHLLVAGGATQWWLGFSAGWGNYGGRAVTKPILFPRDTP